MYDDMFKDKIEGINFTYVYGVNYNGDVYITNYVNECGICKDLYLGNYPRRSALPKNSYNWDIDSIPTVKDFHIWISENMPKVEKLEVIKCQLENDLYSIETELDLVTLLEQVLQKLK